MTLARWMRLTEIPLMVSAIGFLIAYAWAVLGQLRGGWSLLASAVMTLSWAIVLLPMLRPLRLLRLVSVLAVFQRIGGTHLVGRVALYVSASTVLLIFVGSLAMLSVERGRPGATITSYGDALWWAVVTMTTVGYGDMYPVSAEGRMIAVALMVGGIALLGVVTATVATWLIQKVSEQDEASQAATRAQVRELTEEVRALRASLLPAEPVLPTAGATRPTWTSSGGTG